MGAPDDGWGGDEPASGASPSLPRSPSSRRRLLRLRRVGARVGDLLFDDASPDLDRFGSLLTLTIAAVIALSLIDVQSISDDLARGVLAIVLQTTTGVTLVLALRASGVARRARRVAEVIVVLAFVLSVITLLVEQLAESDAEAWQSDRPSPIWIAIALVTPVAVVRRLVTHRSVSTGTLAGAISAYLLIAIAFSFLFSFLDGVFDDGFFRGDEPIASDDFMYFSLVTITTVGYGDLAPSAPIGRLLATSEAVIGQVYLVTFVAMLVGLMIQQRDLDRP
jgi:hypothetical protein